jgi:hypothetical protein
VIDEKDCNNCAHHRQEESLHRPAYHDPRRIDCMACLDTPPEGEKLPFWQPLVRR